MLRAFAVAAGFLASSFSDQNIVIKCSGISSSDDRQAREEKRVYIIDAANKEVRRFDPFSGDLIPICAGCNSVFDPNKITLQIHSNGRSESLTIDREEGTIAYSLLGFYGAIGNGYYGTCKSTNLNNLKTKPRKF